MFAKVTHTQTHVIKLQQTDQKLYHFDLIRRACMFHMFYVFIEIQRAVPKAGKIGKPHQILPVRHARMWLSCHPYERTAPCPSGFAA